MHRIDHATAVANMHGPGKAGFGAGNPTISLPATRFTPAWASDVQENICRVIERFLGEGTLDKANGEQLADAIEQAIATAIAGIDLPDAAPSTLGRHTIFVPATALVADDTAAPATYEAKPGAGTNMVKARSFSDTTPQYLYLPVAMPKSWNEGTIHLRFHWFRAGASAGDVAWKAEALARVAGGAVAHSFGGAASASTITAAAGSNLMATSAEIALAIAGAPERSWLDIRLSRDAANGADTLAEAAILLGIEAYYTTSAGTDD